MTVRRRTYSPRGSARGLFACRAPEVLLSGPAGTGKSRACLEKLHHMCMANPGMKALIVRKYYSTLAATALATYRNDVATQNIADGDVKWFGGSGSVPAGFQYGNGSTIAVGGMDKATKIMSSEYDVAYVQEAIELTENDWEAITTRLRNGKVSFQQLIADTNPSTPTHWLKQRCDRGLTVLMDTDHTDNPRYFNGDGTVTAAGADYIGKLDNLTGVRHARLRKGLWVASEGLIYEELDPAVHFVAKRAVPAAWPRWWAIDFGFTNPFVLQCWAEDPDGRLWLYREMYMTGRLVEDHAAKIMSIVAPPDPETGQPVWIEPKPVRVICDHDAEGRGTFTKHTGLATTAANKAVSTGIQAVQARLRAAADGRPRLFLMRDSLVERDQALADQHKPTCALEEMPGYIWDLGARTAVEAGKAPKEIPLKENDHSMDALRYVVTHRDLRRTVRLRQVS